MSFSALVPVRMNSKRLPGKALRKINGKPLIEYLLDRLHRSRKIGQIIVATSQDPADQAIADYCLEKKYECYRGPLENVALRFKQIIETYGLKNFIRACGDSPLIDWRLIDQGIEIFENGNYDLVTNRFPQTFPKGETVEIVRAQIFLEAYPRMKTAEEFEHVTWHFYQNPAQYRIRNFDCKGDYSAVNLCVDTPEDLDRFGRTVKQMQRSAEEYSWRQCLEIQKSFLEKAVSGREQARP